MLINRGVIGLVDPWSELEPEGDISGFFLSSITLSIAGGSSANLLTFNTGLDEIHIAKMLLSAGGGTSNNNILTIFGNNGVIEEFDGFYNCRAQLNITENFKLVLPKLTQVRFSYQNLDPAANNVNLMLSGWRKQ